MGYEGVVDREQGTKGKANLKKRTPRERFADNLVQARGAAGVTQEDLGNRCHLHRTEISLLERGGREPRLGTIIKLSSALKVTPESLCAGISWNEKAQRFEYKGPDKR